jgi:hypothetical protein
LSNCAKSAVMKSPVVTCRRDVPPDAGVDAAGDGVEPALVEGRLAEGAQDDG